MIDFDAIMDRLDRALEGTKLGTKWNLNYEETIVLAGRRVGMSETEIAIATGQTDRDVDNIMHRVSSKMGPDFPPSKRHGGRHKEAQ